MNYQPFPPDAAADEIVEAVDFLAQCDNCQSAGYLDFEERQKKKHSKNRGFRYLGNPPPKKSRISITQSLKKAGFRRDSLDAGAVGMGRPETPAVSVDGGEVVAGNLYAEEGAVGAPQGDGGGAPGAGDQQGDQIVDEGATASGEQRGVLFRRRDHYFLHYTY